MSRNALHAAQAMAQTTRVSGQRMTADQADGLRRLFAGRAQRFVPLVANPHVAFASVVLERVTACLTLAGATVLLVDAAETSPVAPDMSWLDLAACIERLDERTFYLAARGMPRTQVDARGSARRWLDVLGQSAPQADVVLVHGEATDLARVFQRSLARPMLIASDQPEAVKHAYAAAKLLARRAALATFDVLLCAPSGSRHARPIIDTMAACAEDFFGSVMHDWAAIDPASDIGDAPGTALCRVMREQMQIEDSASPAQQALPASPTNTTAVPAWHATTP